MRRGFSSPLYENMTRKIEKLLQTLIIKLFLPEKHFDLSCLKIYVDVTMKEIEYVPGVISIMPSKVHHEVHAGEEGLFLFAKFMPALC